MMEFIQVVLHAEIKQVRFHHISEVLAHYMPKIGRSKGLIYVGANTGQELDLCKMYTNQIYAFEAIKDSSVWDVLCTHVDATTQCLNYAVSDKNGWIPMWPASNNWESSSLLKPEKHLTEFTHVKFGEPIMVSTRRLDSFTFIHDCDVIIMDVQGAELQVLDGISEFTHINMIILEYISAHMYESACTFDQLYDKLTSHGFTYYESFGVYSNPHTQAYAGNAVFVKSGLIGEHDGI